VVGLCCGHGTVGAHGIGRPGVPSWQREKSLRLLKLKFPVAQFVVRHTRRLTTVVYILGQGGPTPFLSSGRNSLPTGSKGEETLLLLFLKTSCQFSLFLAILVQKCLDLRGKK
jgi:hypothetical protein